MYKLTEQEKHANLALNRKNGWAISTAELRNLAAKHKVGDARTRAVIEHRLSEMNYHDAVGFMQSGEYDKVTAPGKQKLSAQVGGQGRDIETDTNANLAIFIDRVMMAAVMKGYSVRGAELKTGGYSVECKKVGSREEVKTALIRNISDLEALALDLGLKPTQNYVEI